MVDYITKALNMHIDSNVAIQTPVQQPKPKSSHSQLWNKKVEWTIRYGTYRANFGALELCVEWESNSGYKVSVNTGTRSLSLKERFRDAEPGQKAAIELAIAATKQTLELLEEAQRSFGVNGDEL